MNIFISILSETMLWCTVPVLVLVGIWVDRLHLVGINHVVTSFVMTAMIFGWVIFWLSVEEEYKIHPGFSVRKNSSNQQTLMDSAQSDNDYILDVCVKSGESIIHSRPISE